jgi:hypothetical protein
MHVNGKVKPYNQLTESQKVFPKHKRKSHLNQKTPSKRFTTAFKKVIVNLRPILTLKSLPPLSFYDVRVLTGSSFAVMILYEQCLDLNEYLASKLTTTFFSKSRKESRWLTHVFMKITFKSD